jgi:glutamyl-tRNA synthetase
MNKTVVRFAPSPTGALHIGGARTALFNWLYARNKNGKSLLRIEDTDKERSKKEFEDQIIKTLEWLEISPDEPALKQSLNVNKHIEVANTLLNSGHAYKCYCTQEELELEKEEYRRKNLPYTYSRKCRNLNNGKGPFIVRFKSKETGFTILKDLVQGDVEIPNSTIEDFVILRTDNTPTYQLSASVDDHLMNITHVIRGDDHKINTFKQMQIFEAMNWDKLIYAHIPLIHSKEGKKLSKRDGAITVADYQKIGILPESLRNYLLKLGWSYKDKEIFSLEESIQLFNLEGIGKSPSKLDMERVLSLNETYIKNINEDKLFDYFKNYIDEFKSKIDEISLNKIKKNLSIFKNKAKTLEDIFNNCNFIFNFQTIDYVNIIDENAKKLVNDFYQNIANVNDQDFETCKEIINDIINKNKIKFKDFGQPIRLVLTGSKFAPSINDIIQSLGIDEVKKRLKHYL